MPRPRDLNEKYEVGKSGRKEMNKDYGSIASLINNEVSSTLQKKLEQSICNNVLRCTVYQIVSDIWTTGFGLVWLGFMNFIVLLFISILSGI